MTEQADVIEQFHYLAGHVNLRRVRRGIALHPSSWDIKLPVSIISTAPILEHSNASITTWQKKYVWSLINKINYSTKTSLIESMM